VLLCDRHRGAGSDGVLVAKLDREPFELRIVNPDGSEAEKSGNGLRIFAAYVHGRGLVGNDWFRVKLVGDEVSLRVEGPAPGGQLQVRAEMGRASFRGDAVKFTPNAGETLDYELTLPSGATARINTVSLSNPHCVVFVDALERADFLERGSALCTHEAFAAGTNVQLARVIDASTLEAWIWERGAGETLASGSSACAVAAAAVRRGFVNPGAFEVRMQGGSVEVEIGEDYQVKLRGPAQMVYGGELAPGLFEVMARA
jgi:diaminopimelate epimerase